MPKDTCGVRILPSLIYFNDTEINTVYKVNVTVKNVSSVSKSIRYYGPQSKKFTLRVENPEKPVAPGLEVPAVVEYSNSEHVNAKDRLVVTVDGDIVEVPIRAYCSQPQLELQGPVNFGNVVLAAKTISRDVVIYNNGAKTGRFSITYKGDKPLSIIPSSGSVQPKTAQTIKVEYVTKAPGKFDEEAQVDLNGDATEPLKILGNIVERSLELVDRDGRKIECLQFGATYYGTDITDFAYLYNNSPESVNFVCVLDEDVVGQELGVDLTMSTAATVAQSLQPKNPGELNKMNSLVSAAPNEGILNPYDKMMICFRFSPRWQTSKQGFGCSVKAPPRQDFAVFMRFQVVGSKESLTDAFVSSSHIADVHAEVALTGTALPVLLSVLPTSKFDFGECPAREHVDAICTLRNDSPILPARYQFRRIAHFRAHPPKGRIAPGQSQDIIFSFAPNQIGFFKQIQYIDVLGEVDDCRDPFMSFTEVISSVPVDFIARSDSISVTKKPKLVPGITPKLTNEVGLHTDGVPFKEAEQMAYVKGAMPATRGMSLHRASQSAPHERSKGVAVHEGANGDGVIDSVAFPNDRATSVKPTKRGVSYRTIFTKTKRHNYVDPDYAYTDEEMRKIKKHKEQYTEFINEMRLRRKDIEGTKEYMKYKDNGNIGIKVAAGLRPRKLTVEDIVPDPRQPTPPNQEWRLVSSKELGKLESSMASKEICEGLNAIPITDQEKKECSSYLSPHDLHKVVVGPAVVDFGDVCVRSVNTRNINIVNNLDQHIYVIVSIDCRELRQTSPLAQVVMPMSKATVPLIFESGTAGTFQRSADYRINGFYKNHVTVLANVVAPEILLSADSLEVQPTPVLPAEAGMRSVLTLRNPLNYPAVFNWTPVIGQRGTAFSIRPATGTVDAHQELDCEVVFHPSYQAPDTGRFRFFVEGSNVTKHLECSATFGPTHVEFIDRRVMFGTVPLNLTTTKSALLYNGSNNHAYYQVLDPNPFPGLVVAPAHGVVPIGGKAELQIHLTPMSMIKFDTRVQIAIRGWKTLELRMGGSVEPPCVDINLNSFQFGGVPCGSSLVRSFSLINRTVTRTRVEFDLRRFHDFSLAFPGCHLPEDLTFQAQNPCMYTVTVGPSEEITGQLIFKPTEVAAYDFVLPVSINSLNAPTPTQTPIPPTPNPSNKNTIQNIINPKVVPVVVATPCKHVMATGLRPPLQLSSPSVSFELESDFFEEACDMNYQQNKAILLLNNGNRAFKWHLDLSDEIEAIEDGTFRFTRADGVPYLTHADGGVEGSLKPGETWELRVTFCPEKPGIYRASVPVLLNDTDHPYQHLSITGEWKCPKVTFEPHSLVLTPVPLFIKTTGAVQLRVANYPKPATLRASLPEVMCEDGSVCSPLSLSKEDGEVFDEYEIVPDKSAKKPSVLTLLVNFQNNKPLAFTQPIVFHDASGNRFELPVSATSDNCLLTVYPFVAQHRLDHQIVCEEGKMLRSLKGRALSSSEPRSYGEPVLAALNSPAKASRPSTSATSSQFEVSSSSYETLSQSDSINDDLKVRNGAVNRVAAEERAEGREGAAEGETPQEMARRSLGSNLFPDEETEEGLFYQEVLLAVQRWFSAHGWPGGPFPIFIPHSLRSGITKQTSEKAKSSTGGHWDANNLRKDLKTVYDMIVHLAGRAIPGIPLNGPLPRDPTERVKQVHWQHATMLMFIRNQGGCVASVRPEFLMEPDDYKHWKWVQEVIQTSGDLSTASKATPTENEAIVDDMIFDAVSKRAWTDTLLQLWKTMVLSRVTPQRLKSSMFPDASISVPQVNPDPLSSNVYSLGERVVLAWLNSLYDGLREKIWASSPKGGVPPTRWVVNFDHDLLDGLVLGAALGGYCPFLIHTHLKDMYTSPTTAEQCLHNALKVVSAMQSLGLDYDVQAIDITDPNPVAMLMLVIYLYQKLPFYIPKKGFEFVGALHQPVMRQVQLTNPSSNKHIEYMALMAGRDARDFNIQGSGTAGGTISVPPKGTVNIAVEFKSRFLRVSEATLILVGRRVGSTVGTTLSFRLIARIDDITSAGTARTESPCYELQKVQLHATNPFAEAAQFKVVLVEVVDEEDGASLVQGSTKPSLIKKKKRKSKTVRARTDHGQKKSEPTPSPELILTPKDAAPTSPQLGKRLESNVKRMCAFFCPANTVHLAGHETRTVEVHFLPFNMGAYKCSVVLMNENVGEFLYTVHATATLPRVVALPFPEGPNTVRLSSAAAASRGRGVFGGQDEVVYWSCEVGHTLRQTLQVPLTNARREEALITAAHQQMSEMEYERRRVTGTLNSSTITTKALRLLSVDASGELANQPKALALSGTSFEVSADSKFYEVPKTLTMPHPTCVPKPTSKRNSEELIVDEGTVDLPVTFYARSPGHYPCEIVLKAPDDVRVYRVECTVNPPGSNAQLEFSAPVHQSVVQNIPIVNSTSHDWNLVAQMSGPGFYGPPSMVAKACQTTSYPLMFRPSYEGGVQGKLVLDNARDAHEHVFTLLGQAEKPLPLDHIQIATSVGEPWSRIIDVPNVTNKKLIYRAESSLPFITGIPIVTVLEGQTGKYEVKATPQKSGQFNGVISFIAGKNPVVEYDSDGDEICSEDAASSEYAGYRVWYSIGAEITCAPPIKCLLLRCSCHKHAVLEIPVSNPGEEEMVLEVNPQGLGVSGESTLVVPAKSRSLYELEYNPTCIGETVGRLTFYHETTGEFWYEIKLVAENPEVTNLKTMECEIGRWTQQTITLTNPTNETLSLVPTVSNTNNFSLERDNEMPICLKPRSDLGVSLTFTPSALGQEGHMAKVTFHSKQLGEWIFSVSGTGCLPEPQDPVSLTCPAQSSTTVIIPFRNPLDYAVTVDVLLTAMDSQFKTVLHPEELPPGSPFCLLLRRSAGVRIGPKSCLDIPVSFAPEEMTRYEALCVVSVKREDCRPIWPKAELPSDTDAPKLHGPLDDNGALSEIRWLYPLHGMPEVANKSSKPALIQCQARDRAEERVVVTLSGVAPSIAGPQRAIRTRAVTPKDVKPTVPKGTVVAEGSSLLREFTYSLAFDSAEARDDLTNATALSLLRQQRDPQTGLVDLVFNVIYSPLKLMSHSAQLHVLASSGGMWKFPLQFLATEPVPDDIITIEAAGLNKASCVGFRLTSQTSDPVPYTAYFLSGGDPVFEVSPASGELLPKNTQGSLIKLTFNPSKYGKKYGATLVVQTHQMQWTYEVRGVLPEYFPPRQTSANRDHPDPRLRTGVPNFVLENIKMETTAVSSPIKGAPLLKGHARSKAPRGSGDFTNQ